MATMTYTAKSRDGRITRGRVDASSAQDAMRQLKRSGVQVVSLDKTPASSGGIGVRFAALTRKRIKSKELLWTLAQLQLMVGTGTGLDDALKIAGESARNERLHDVLIDLRERVKKGQSFSEALSAHTDVFDMVIVRMISAGEASGTLAAMLGTVHEMMRKQSELRRMIIAAAAYPVILLSVASGALTILFMYVLPKFAKVFNEVGAELPGVTVAVMSVSKFFVSNKFVLGVGFAAIVMTALKLRKIPSAMVKWNTWLLGIPVVGMLIRASNTARAMQTMGTLWSAGLAITEVTRLTGATMRNPLYQNFFEQLRQSLIDGKRLTSSFGSTDLFPHTVAPLIRTGEQTGTTPEVLRALADYHEKETQGLIKTMITLLEPAIIIVMAGAVGVIAISVVLPLFRLSSAIH
jgi:type IV pilus assembly protein PilC